ncbi:hypothetical protein JMN23_24885 [Bacillus sp. RHFB]|nr:hypothetical protein [Bacillus sp. RHFB]
MTTGQFLISLIATLASIGASISAIINARTARRNLAEVLENNKRTLRPHLIIKPKEVDLLYNQTDAPHMLNWDTHTYDLRGEDNYTSSTSSVSYLELVNLTNGIAKNVKININLNNERTLINMIERRSNYPEAPYLMLQLSKELNKWASPFESLFVNYVTENIINGAIEHFNFEPTSKQFVAVEKDNDYKVVIPDTFMVMFNIYFSYKEYFPPEKRPYLDILIELEDIVGNKYKHHYLFKIQDYNIKTNNGKTVEVKTIFDISEHNLLEDWKDIW